jgi:dTDP-3-amino-3,4,6-trideoxy-alpha-D-glucose transaminase
LSGAEYEEMQVKANWFDRMWNACGTEIMEAIGQVGASGWYILGQEVKSFERELADYCGAKHAVGCGNGMDALEISLRALGLQAGQKVLTTPLSAFATTLAIVRAGGIPVFCDVDENGLLDLDQADACLQKNPDIHYVMPVHLYGHALDFVRLKDIITRYDVVVVEDAAQAIGARRDGQGIGSAGRTTCFSFYPTKNLGTLGDGGAIITNDDNVCTELMTLRNYGQKERYIHTRIGLNSRLDELHAAILRRALLPRLSAWTRRRQDIAKYYYDGITHHSVVVRGSPDFTGSVWHLFPVMVPAQKRVSFLGWLRQNGVEADVHYPRLIPDQDALKSISAAPMIFGPLTRAKEFTSQEVSLPINAFLTEQEVEHVVATINAWRE